MPASRKMCTGKSDGRRASAARRFRLSRRWLRVESAGTATPVHRAVLRVAVNAGRGQIADPLERRRGGGRWSRWWRNTGSWPASPAASGGIDTRMWLKEDSTFAVSSRGRSESNGYALTPSLAIAARRPSSRQVPATVQPSSFRRRANASAEKPNPKQNRRPADPMLPRLGAIMSRPGRSRQPPDGGFNRPFGLK